MRFCHLLPLYPLLFHEKIIPRLQWHHQCLCNHRQYPGSRSVVLSLRPLTEDNVEKQRQQIWNKTVRRNQVYVRPRNLEFQMNGVDARKCTTKTIQDTSNTTDGASFTTTGTHWTLKSKVIEIEFSAFLPKQVDGRWWQTMILRDDPGCSTKHAVNEQHEFPLKSQEYGARPKESEMVCVVLLLPWSNRQGPCTTTPNLEGKKEKTHFDRSFSYCILGDFCGYFPLFALWRRICNLHCKPTKYLPT